MGGVPKDAWAVLRRGWWLVLGGGVVGGIGAVQDAAGLVYSRDGWHWPVWYWVLVPLVAYIISAHWVLKERREERDAALANARSVTAKMVEIGAGGSVDRSEISKNLMMMIGTGGPGQRLRRRRRARRLSKSARTDLADRCEACSTEMLEWFYGRAEPYRPWVKTEEERKQRDREQHEHRSETDKQFGIQFAARARDLLNECVEAGYSFERELDLFRTIGWTNREESVGTELGVLARRVRRQSKAKDKS